MRLLLLFILISCNPSPKKNEFNPPNSKPFESKLNSDGDMFTDAEEVRLGMNPLEADLPVIQNYFQGKFELGHDYQSGAKEKIRFQVEQTAEKEQVLPLYAGLREMLTYEVATLNNFREALEKTTSPYLEKIDGLAILPYPSIKNYPEQLAKGLELSSGDKNIAESGQISFQLRQTMRFPKTIEVDQIRLRMALVQKKEQHLTGLLMQQDHAGDPKVLQTEKSSPFLNNFYFRDLSPELIHKVLSRQEKFYLGIEDFRVHYPGRESLSYQALMESVQKKCVQIVISTPEKTQRYFIVPKENLKKTLEQVSVKLEINNHNEILAVDGLISETLDFPVNLSSIHPKNLQSKKWFLLRSKGERALQPGQAYYLVYLSAEDLLHTQNKKRLNFGSELLPWVPRQYPVQYGDELIIKVTGKDVSVGQYQTVERPFSFVGSSHLYPKFTLINLSNKTSRELVVGKDYHFALTEPEKAWFFLKVNLDPKELLHNYSLQISSGHAKLPTGRILKYTFQAQQDGLF